MSVAADTDLEVIEALDFKEALPCEGAGHAERLYGHEGDGWALVECVHPCFDVFGVRLVLCRAFYDACERIGPDPCHICGKLCTVSDFLKVVEIL